MALNGGQNNEVLALSLEQFFSLEDGTVDSGLLQSVFVNNISQGFEIVRKIFYLSIRIT